MKKSALALLSMVFLFAAAGAQEQPLPLDAGERHAVVNAAADALAKQYVFPDVARRMGDLIRRNLKSGKYEALSDPWAFAERLTADLRSISRDRHLGVRFAPERIKEIRTPNEAKKKAAEEFQKKLNRMENHGFREVKILEGNVGYLKFDFFSAAADSFPVAAGAMAFLANCDALVIDLRENGGGSPEMIQFLSSYFFSGEPRHLNSFYYRLGEKTEQYWTQVHVPGQRRPDLDLYVLTSGRTFSGAEEFTYNLKNMKRATIVGETSGGGAHPVRMEILSDRFAMGVPYARAVNPISQTNWEGTGVEPDVQVPAGQALDKAHALALEKLAANEKDERIQKGYQWALEGLKSGMNLVILPEELLKSYAGGYGPRKITFENGSLYYQREEGAKMRMIPMGEELFRFAEIDYFRLRIVKADGRVTGVEGRYNDGSVDFNPIDR
ncbi:MAG: S41 family peptidase [Candidatus Aminicenantes bacterium]|nr:S41 family peptidase [Candidatus Aminicenantes bacterium]